MAKWFKLIDKNEWINIDAALRVVPIRHPKAFLRIWTDGKLFVDLIGVDAEAVGAYLATQGVDIDFEKFRTDPDDKSGWAAQ